MSAVAESIQTEMPAPFVFIDSAAAKVADLIAEEGNPELKPKLKSMDEVDPELLRTVEKLGVPLHKRMVLAGVAVMSF